MDELKIRWKGNGAPPPIPVHSHACWTRMPMHTYAGISEVGEVYGGSDLDQQYGVIV